MFVKSRPADVRHFCLIAELPGLPSFTCSSMQTWRQVCNWLVSAVLTRTHTHTDTHTHTHTHVCRSYCEGWHVREWLKTCIALLVYANATSLYAECSTLECLKFTQPSAAERFRTDLPLETSFLEYCKSERGESDFCVDCWSEFLRGIYGLSVNAIRRMSFYIDILEHVLTIIMNILLTEFCLQDWIESWLRISSALRCLQKQRYIVWSSLMIFSWLSQCQIIATCIILSVLASFM